jgi:hypothetical protein
MIDKPLMYPKMDWRDVPSLQGVVLDHFKDEQKVDLEVVVGGTYDFNKQKEPAPPFRVFLSVMKESHQTTYWVTLDRADRPLDAKPWDTGGRISPFYSANKFDAEQEAKVWAQFLGVEVTR